MTCQVLDFWCWTSNEIIGDVWLAIFLFALVILYISSVLKLPKEVHYIMLLLIMAALFSKTLILIIWVYIVLVVGLVVYYTMSKKLGG